MPPRRGRPPHADVLTPSEWRTVHFVQHGLSNGEIARRRGVSVDAVKFHVSNALSKLRLRNRRRDPQGPHASAAQVRAAQVRAASVPAVPGLALRVCHRRDLLWGRSDQARACRRRRLSRVHPLFRAHRDDRKSELFEPALILDHLAMQSVARMSRDGLFASAHARSRPQQDTAST